VIIFVNLFFKAERIKLIDVLYGFNFSSLTTAAGNTLDFSSFKG